MIDSYIRKKYQTFFIDPWIQISLFKKISPHLITAIACLIGIAAAFFFFYHHWVVASFLLFLSGYFDTLDGSIARAFHKVSDIGSVLDIVLDRVVEFALVLSLYLQNPLERGLVTIWIMAGILFCMVTFLVIGIFTQNHSEKSFYYSPGLIERTEAFGFIFAMNIFPAFYSILAWAFVALMLATAALRLYQFIRFSNQPRGSWQKDCID